MLVATGILLMLLIAGMGSSNAARDGRETGRRWARKVGPYCLALTVLFWSAVFLWR